MKLFKLFLFALALSFVAPQAIDAKPRKKHRTTRVKKSKKRRGRCRHLNCYKMNDYPDVDYTCKDCGYMWTVYNAIR